MDPLTMMALVQAGSGAYRYARAQKGISDLEAQDRRKFMDASGPLQENKFMSQQRMKYGLRPESRQLALNEQMRQERNLLSTPASGQLRDQLGRTASATRGQFGLQLSAQDQAIRDAAAQNIMQSNQQLMQLDLQDISQENQEYLQQMAGYGQARQDARKTILGAGQGIATAAMMGYYDGVGGAKTTAPKTEKPLIKTEEKPYVPADPSLTQKQTPLELNLGGAPRSKYDNAGFYGMGAEGTQRYQTFPTTAENTISAPGQMSSADELTGGMSSLQMGPSGPPAQYSNPKFPIGSQGMDVDVMRDEVMPSLYVDMGPGRHMVQTLSGEQVVVPKSVKTYGDLDNFLNPNYNPMGLAGRADEFPIESKYEGMTPQPMFPNQDKREIADPMSSINRFYGPNLLFGDSVNKPLTGTVNLAPMLGMYPSPMSYSERFVPAPQETQLNQYVGANKLYGDQGQGEFVPNVDFQQLSENRIAPYGRMGTGPGGIPAPTYSTSGTLTPSLTMGMTPFKLNTSPISAPTNYAPSDTLTPNLTMGMTPFTPNTMGRMATPSTINMGMYTPVASPYRSNLPYGQYGQYKLAPYSAKRR